MKVHSVVLCRKFHPNDEYHRRTAVIFGNFLSPTSQRPTLKSYSSEGHPRTRSFSSVPQGYMPCGELVGFLFCLTCFVRAEEVQFEEAPKSPRAIPSVTGTQLLRTNKTRKAKKQTTVSSERHVSLRNRREKTSPWVPFVPL